ncbi:PH-like domain-containing protein [Herbiconiux sp. YIM B11900]|uniref:PH-like domain-containing protein n=1 Tax=Herbiconiux sp. YIM B11900 TaxID=3404131 RepID=UPI003F855289
MDSHLVPGLLVTVLAILLLLAMVLAWRARKRRQAAFRQPSVAAPDQVAGTEIASVPVLYVATTTAGDPLDRLTIPGLAFRGRGVVSVSDTGVTLTIPGEPVTFVARAALRSVGRSTWAIDRVVETGGLVRLDWTYDAADRPADVESYLRATGLGDANRIIEAVNTLIPEQSSPQQEGTSS